MIIITVMTGLWSEQFRCRSAETSHENPGGQVLSCSRAAPPRAGLCLPEPGCTAASPYRSAQHCQPKARHCQGRAELRIAVPLLAASYQLSHFTTYRDAAVMMVFFLPNLPLNLKAVLGEKAAFHQHLRNTKEKQSKTRYNREASPKDRLPSHSVIGLTQCPTLLWSWEVAEKDHECIRFEWYLPQKRCADKKPSSPNLRSPQGILHVLKFIQLSL